MDEITTLAAGWGAILSTCVFLWQLLENTRRMKVTLNISLTKNNFGNVETLLSLQASNISKRPISLSSYGLKLPDEKQLWFPNESPDRFPTTLTDGHACTMWRNIRSLAQSIKDEGFSGDISIIGLFRDVTGKEYHSKKMIFNPQRWIEGVTDN